MQLDAELAAVGFVGVGLEVGTVDIAVEIGEGNLVRSRIFVQIPLSWEPVEVAAFFAVVAVVAVVADGIVAVAGVAGIAIDAVAGLLLVRLRIFPLEEIDSTYRINRHLQTSEGFR